MLHVTAANDAALQCDLTLHRLECAEHLPVSGQEAAPAAATLAEVVISVLILSGRDCCACVERFTCQGL